LSAPSARAAAPAPASGPGRTCPVSYRYSPRVFDRAPDLIASTLYAVGGLYGNVEALSAVLDLARAEPGPVAIVFNGDFHWFDVDHSGYQTIARAVAQHHGLRGNVETELARDDSDAGCGCAYPADVSDAEVHRSNAIHERLRETARRDETSRRALAGLPMHLVASVGGARVGLVHGDAGSLAGWGFAASRLDASAHRRWIDDVFAQAHVDVFACSHTCLAAMRQFDLGGRHGVVANNGAAGMPNFAGTRYGVITRIAERRHAGRARLYGREVQGVHVEALRVDYDHDPWLRRFLASWPEGSDAYASYYRRLCDGPHHRVADAEPRPAA
jgi:hypothetical protein